MGALRGTNACPVIQVANLKEELFTCVVVKKRRSEDLQVLDVKVCRSIVRLIPWKCVEDCPTKHDILILELMQINLVCAS